MIPKAQKITAQLSQWEGRGADPHCAGYVDCFNRGLFYEAHDVLEQLWLPQRRGPDGNFYKGLIQFAGAFVHLQKNRLRPAAALFKLAEANLAGYPREHQNFSVREIENVIKEWLEKLEGEGFLRNPLALSNPPSIVLLTK